MTVINLHHSLEFEQLRSLTISADYKFSMYNFRFFVIIKRTEITQDHLPINTSLDAHNPPQNEAYPHRMRVNVLELIIIL
jgi:hypothetical protein